jgi:hypothetical protein
MDWKIKALHALGLSQPLDQGQIDRAIEALVSDSLLYRRGVAYLLREPLAQIVTDALTSGERKGLKTRIANFSRIPLVPEGDERQTTVWDLFESSQKDASWVLSASCGGTKLYWFAPKPALKETPATATRTAGSQVLPVTLEQLDLHIAAIRFGDVAPPAWLLKKLKRLWGNALGLL